MPSTAQRFRNAEDEDDEVLGGNINLQLFTVFIALLIFCNCGMQLHVIASDEAALKSCGLIYIREAFFFSGIGLFGFIGVPSIFFTLALVSNYTSDNQVEVNCRSWVDAFVLVCVLAVGGYFFAAMGASIMTWFNVSQVEEIYPFYAEFYEVDYANCASGEDLKLVELAVVLFRIDRFISMMSILLVVPVLCLIGMFVDIQPSEEPSVVL